MADILTTSISGLRSYQTALATTSHNIANVGNDAYTRQRVELDARLPLKEGSSFIGQGVDVSNIQRIYDQYVVERLRTFTSSTSSLDTFLELASRVENLIADENSGLSSALDGFFNAMNDVANDPSASAPRVTLLGEAEILEQRFNSISKDLQNIENEVDDRIRYEVAEINSITTELARLNKTISSMSGVSNPPLDLLDQRDELIKQLSEKVSVNTVQQNDGTLNVMVGSGQMLVSGSTSVNLVARASSSQPDRMEVALQSNNSTVNITNSLSGGELGGLLNFRENMLDDAQNSLGRTAIALAESFNALHVQGYDLNGDMGSNFFNSVGTGNLTGVFGGDYLNNGFDVGDTVSFDLQFDGRTVNVSHTIVAGDTNQTIANALLFGASGINADGNVTDNGDGTYTLAGTSTGISMTFRLRGDQIEFQTAGGPSLVGSGNNLTITNVTDGVADDLIIQMGQIGSSSTALTSGTATNASPASFLGPSNRNSVLANQNNIGTAQVDFSITDVSALSTSDYLISYDGANYNVVRLSDNVTMASGAGPFNVDGLSINVNGVSNTGDSFYLRPTRLGATSFQRNITDPNDVAAATPIRTATSVSNIGNGQMSSGQVIDSLDPNLLRTVDIYFDPANPSGTFDVVDRTSGTILQNNVAYSSGMQVTQNGWQVQLTGIPQPGDVFSVSENTGAATDNRNALLMAGLQSAGILDGGATTLEQSYAALTAEVGTVTRQVQINSDVEHALLDGAIAERESLSGVNLDEEAADLIRFQQAYQALSRVIQASQELFQSLLDAV